MKDLVQLGLMIGAVGLTLSAWRWRRPPSLGYALVCFALGALMGGYGAYSYDQIQAYHGTWGALLPLLTLMGAVVLGGGFALAAIVELLRVIVRGLSH